MVSLNDVWVEFAAPANGGMKIHVLAAGLITSVIALVVTSRSIPKLHQLPPIVTHAPAIKLRAAAPIGSLYAKHAVLSASELRKLHANEVGVVPILEYHDIRAEECRLGRSRSNFKKDLNRL